MNVRLQSGKSSNEGIVQVRYFNSWIPVCRDHGWDVRDARVVCHQQGYGEAVIGYKSIFDDDPSGYEVQDDRTSNTVITIDRVRCHGNETNIAQCKYEVQFSQSCRYAASVTCHTPRAGK